MATGIEVPFRESLFRRRPDQPAADQVAVIGAAHALANPSGEHLDRLYGLLETTPQRELIFVGVALARCLEHDGPRRGGRRGARRRAETAAQHARPSRASTCA